MTENIAEAPPCTYYLFHLTRRAPSIKCRWRYDEQGWQKHFISLLCLIIINKIASSHISVDRKTNCLNGFVAVVHIVNGCSSCDEVRWHPLYSTSIIIIYYLIIPKVFHKIANYQNERMAEKERIEEIEFLGRALDDYYYSMQTDADMTY